VDDGEPIDDLDEEPSVEEVNLELERGANEQPVLSSTHVDRIIRAQRTVSLVVIIGGLIIATGGIVLLLLGVSGQVDWNFAGVGINSKLQTGAVGLAVALIGAIIVIAGSRQFRLKISERLRE